MNNVSISESVSQSSFNLLELNQASQKINNILSEQKNLCDCQPKILIVEDNVFNMMAVSSIILQKFKIKPSEATNGQIGIDMFRDALAKPCQCANRAFKLIFMDI